MTTTLEADLCRHIEAIPPLPAVAMRVLRLVRDPEFAMPDLVNIVQTDPALTGTLLELCNSSLFALPNRIGSVAQALSFLGVRNIVRVVMAACTSRYFRFDRKGDAYLNPKEIWRHSVACGSTSQLLAKGRDDVDGGIAFTAGILHNIGKIALAQIDYSIEHPRARARPKTGDVLLDAERDKYGFDHIEVAERVVRAWQLPPELERAICHHHDDAAIENDPSSLTAIVHIADSECLRAKIGSLPTRELAPTPSAKAIARLALKADRLAGIGEEIRGLLRTSEEIVNMV